MPRWPFGARDTCESCKSIDVRQWYRRGRLSAGQTFSWAWTCAGEASGSILVRTVQDAVKLCYWTRHFPDREGKDIEQRVPITWTACHFGGKRPWFICPAHVNGKYCGRRVAEQGIWSCPRECCPTRRNGGSCVVRHAIPYQSRSSRAFPPQCGPQCRRS
jgi:hypothetical protein